MPRKPKVVVTNNDNSNIKEQRCTHCGKGKPLNEFYATGNILYYYLKKMSVCKECLVDVVYNRLYDEYSNEVMALYELCRLTNSYFEEFLYNSAKLEAENSKTNKIANPIRVYFTKINSLPQYRSKTFKESTSYNKIEEKKEEKVIQVNRLDKRNEEDVLNMLRYDPFESENFEDKRYLYNRLVDYLDDETLHDNFKLSSCIELVKIFNQIDKINMAIATTSGDAEKIASNIGSIKSFVETKDKLYKNALAMAKDNGISINYSNNKSKGGGTLNGIVKKINEIGLENSELNLYDLETCKAMRQIADISHQSILDKIILDENEYTEMISKQKDMIKELDDNIIRLEEENRLLKIKLRKEES